MKKINKFPSQFVNSFIITVFASLISLTVLGQTSFTDARDSVAGVTGFAGEKGKLPSLPVDVSISTAGFTADSGEQAINGKPAVRTAWVYFQAPADGSVNVTVSNISSSGARVAVYNLRDDNFYGNSSNSKIGEADTVGGSGSTFFPVAMESFYAIQLDSSTAGTIRLKVSYGTPRYSLSVNVSPTGTGTVNISPVEPTNGYASGTIVTVTASGTNFQGWTGSANGADTSLNVTMNANKTVTAHFGSSEAQILFGGPGGELAVWFMNGGAFNGAAFLQYCGRDWRVVGTSDLNNDSQKDFIFQNTNGQLAYWLMNGNRLLSGAVFGNPGSAWRAVGINDFDGDGKADILFQHTYGTLAVWYMTGTVYKNAAYINNGQSVGAWKVVGIKDFNADTKGDILFQYSDGQVAVWYMNGVTRTGSAYVQSAGSSWKIVGLGDFNNDGKADFLWQSTSRQLAIWMMNGITYVSGNYVNSGAPLTTGWKIFTVK